MSANHPTTPWKETDMHKAILNVLSKRTVGVISKQRWRITGTDRLDGLDHMTEYAVTEKEAWAQALAHSEGTSFTPERIELEG